jgi:hypothetical protein
MGLHRDIPPVRPLARLMFGGCQPKHGPYLLGILGDSLQTSSSRTGQQMAMQYADLFAQHLSSLLRGVSQSPRGTELGACYDEAARLLFYLASGQPPLYNMRSSQSGAAYLRVSQPWNVGLLQS